MLKKMLMTVVLSSNVLVLTGAEMYDAAYKAGREAEKNNDFPAAIEAYQEAAELAGKNEAVKAAMLCHQAEAQRRAKQYDNAIATYRKVLEVEKGGVNEKGLSQLNIGTCLMLQGKYQEAIAEYEKVMSIEKVASYHKSGALLNIGNCFRIQKRYPEAVSAYGKVLTLDNPVPGDVIEALRQTGLCLYLTNKYLEAKASYEKAIASKGIQGWQKKDCQNMLKKIEAALSKAE